MKKNSVLFYIIIASLGFLLAACSFTPKDKDKRLVKVGKKAVTVFDYKQALELEKTSYPHNVTQNRAEFKAVQENLLHDLVEELVLQNAADSMGIKVSRENLKAEIDRIKADYPDDSFEQVLMESAIPYDAWEDRLKNRLLMEKVINEALIDRITVTEEEAREYYRNVYLPEYGHVEKDAAEEQTIRSILENLRRKKAEDAYVEWLSKMQSQYRIELNKAEWQKIISGDAG